jgi:hypothetical protein
LRPRTGENKADWPVSSLHGNRNPLLTLQFRLIQTYFIKHIVACQYRLPGFFGIVLKIQFYDSFIPELG